VVGAGGRLVGKAQVEVGAVAAGRTLAAARRTSKARSGGKAPVMSGRRPARRSVVVVAGRQQHDHHARGLKNEKTAIYKGQ
jgi:hypothetical protein